MDATLERLSTLSRYVSIALKVIMIFFMLIVAATTVLAVMTATDATILADIPDYNKSDMFTISVTAVVSGIFAVALLFILNRLFSNIHRMHSPFTDDNARNLKIIAFLVLLMGIVVPVFEVLASMVYSSGQAPPMDINVGMIFMAFLVYLVSLVFKYGAALQKESDETL